MFVFYLYEGQIHKISFRKHFERLSKTTAMEINTHAPTLSDYVNIHETVAKEKQVDGVTPMSFIIVICFIFYRLFL